MSEDLVTAVVVDDADDVREVVTSRLELSGRFVVLAEGSTGREAIDLAARYQPEVMVLDASMPELDGLDALPEVVAASPGTRIIMLSGFEAGNLRDRAVALGAIDYVEKRAPISELPGRILAHVRPGEDLKAGPVGDDGGRNFAEHLERFRTVFDQAAIGMATLTLTGTIVRANPALAHIVGLEPPELTGRRYADLSHPADRPGVMLTLARAVHMAGPAAEIEHGIDCEPPPRWVKSTLGTVNDTDDRPLYLFAQTEDITHRRHATEELRASEERFRLMVESVQDYAIFMLDETGHIATWNLGAERLKGYRASEIIGQHFRVFYPDEVAASGHPQHELELAVRDGRYEEEGWRLRKDGSRFWANVVITALFGSDRTLIGFAKVTRDMTERRMAVVQSERAAAELAEANHRLQAAARQTDEFVAVTAHELQSPVTVISSTADLLLHHWEQLTPDDRRDALERTLASGARIRRLLSDLLTASQLEAGSFTISPEAVRLAEVIEQALAETASTVPGVSVENCAGQVVRADPERVVQIVTNLVTNAAKYGAPPIVITARESGPDVEIAVRDRGGGVAAELVPHLFDKFARDDRPGNRGVGLGLYIVRQLARRQGGDAWYDSDAGETTFVVRLPKG